MRKNYKRNIYFKISLQITLYPTEVMSPLTIEGMRNDLTDNTVSIHHEIGTWKSEKEQQGIQKLKEIVQYRL